LQKYAISLSCAEDYFNRHFCFLSMQRYANISGRSGVEYYETGKNYIIVQYNDGDRYLYNYEEPGRTDVEPMKKLAREGIGLATYISQHVGIRYAAKL
jgi:hypothetical protein